MFYFITDLYSHKIEHVTIHLISKGIGLTYAAIPWKMWELFFKVYSLNFF